MRVFSDGTDVFATKLKQRRPPVEYLPRQRFDWSGGIAVDGHGNIYVCGETMLLGFAGTAIYTQDYDETFVAQLSNSGPSPGILSWGVVSGHASGIAIRQQRNVYICETPRPLGITDTSILQLVR